MPDPDQIQKSLRPGSSTYLAVGGAFADCRALANESSLVLPLPRKPELLPSVDAVRGTVLLASLHALREHNLFDDYRRALSEECASRVLSTVPGEWVPLEIASAHYQACEDLLLAPSTQLEIGRTTGARAIGTMLGTAVRLSRTVGATPWSLLKGADRIWGRAYNGGGIRVFQLGASDALVEAHANPLLCRLAFCRNSFRGFSLALCGGLSERLSIRESEVTPRYVAFRMLWA